MARLKQFEILFKKASSDLKASKNLSRDFENGDDELDLEIVYFHLQQSSEKYIKSILSLNRINFPKIHDIEELLAILKDNCINFDTDLSLLVDLNDFAVEGRYSIILDDIENSSTYIKIIEKLKIEVDKKIKGNQ